MVVGGFGVEVACGGGDVLLTVHIECHQQLQRWAFIRRG